ncbi:unnamed protein product [Sphagnum tenellum]
MVKNDRNDHVFFTACNDCTEVYAYSKGNDTSLLQALDIGFESKTPLFANDVLCDRTTVKRNCQSRKDSALESLLKDCKDHVVDVREFDGKLHIALNIMANFNGIIEPFITLDDEIRTDLIVVNTDNASNNDGAGGLESKYTRISCADHKVDTCISYVLKKRTREINGVWLPAFYEFKGEALLVFNEITNCKKAVMATK